MVEPCAPGDGTLVKVQVRRAGVMVLQETYIVSRAGDLQRARASALAVATQRRPDLPADDLLARVDPVVDAGVWSPPAPDASRAVPAPAA